MKNQKLAAYELSLTQKIGRDNVLHASVYQNELTDLIFRATSDEQVTGYTTVLQNTNIGSQSAKGVDIRFDSALSADTTAFFNYSYIDAHYQLHGQTLPVARVSEHKWNAGITSSLNHRTTISASVKYVGQISTALSNSKYTDGRKMPEFYELNLHVSYRFNQYVNGYVKLNNMANADIEHGGIFGQSGVMAPTIYQPKFNYSVGLTAQF